MKTLFSFTLLLAGTGILQAAILQDISFDLSALHPGSTLSGTFTLPDSPTAGDTAPVLLTFSDPANYSPTSLNATITIENGTPSGFAVLFSTLMFTNLSGTVTPINTRDVILNGFAFANCPSFPCTATGGFEDRDPPVFRSTYTVTPSAVPEPSYAMLIPALLAVIALGRAIPGKRPR